MTKLLTCLLALCLLICGCKKDDNKEDPNAMKYSISGIADLKLKNIGDTTIFLAIAHTGGNQEKLDLSISDLPANVTASFEPASGTPGYTTSMKFKCTDATPGTYTAKIKATTASSAEKTFEMKLIVEHWNCAANLAGDYDGTLTNYNGTNDATWKVTSVKDGEIKFNNDITATVNCVDRTIVIPEQGQYHTHGTGSFSTPQPYSFNINMKVKTRYDPNLPSTEYETTWELDKIQ